jgi:hypothetical protein
LVSLLLLLLLLLLLPLLLPSAAAGSSCKNTSMCPDQQYSWVLTLLCQAGALRSWCCC